MTALLAALFGLLTAFLAIETAGSHEGPRPVPESAAVAGMTGPGAPAGFLPRGTKIVLSVANSHTVAGHVSAAGVAAAGAPRVAAAHAALLRPVRRSGPIGGELAGGPIGRAPPTTSGS